MSDTITIGMDAQTIDPNNYTPVEGYPVLYKTGTLFEEVWTYTDPHFHVCFDVGESPVATVELYAGLLTATTWTRTLVFAQFTPSNYPFPPGKAAVSVTLQITPTRDDSLCNVAPVSEGVNIAVLRTTAFPDLPITEVEWSETPSGEPIASLDLEQYLVENPPGDPGWTGPPFEIPLPVNSVDLYNGATLKFYVYFNGDNIGNNGNYTFLDPLQLVIEYDDAPPPPPPPPVGPPNGIPLGGPGSSAASAGGVGGTGLNAITQTIYLDWTGAAPSGDNRNWCPDWTTPASSMALSRRSDGSLAILFGTCDGTGRILRLDSTLHDDDGEAFESFYQTAFGGGSTGRNSYQYLTASALGHGQLEMTAIFPDGESIKSLRNLSLQARPNRDAEWRGLRINSERIAWKFGTNDVGHWFKMRKLAAYLRPHPWSRTLGVPS